ncbi:MAG: S8 family serine peptidase [Candidatus Limnocylindria bacterium]
MPRRPLLAFAAAMLLLAGSTPASAQVVGPTASYIVVFHDFVDVGRQTAAFERLHGFTSTFHYTHALKGFAAPLSPLQVAALQATGLVAFVSADREVQATDTVAVNGSDSVPTGVRRAEAGTTTTVQQASTVAVAVIDTGIDLSHPDLNAKNGKNCVSTWANANDDNGHGSHVAGTIAARNNGSGVVGVVPDSAVYAVKVLNSQGSGTWSQVICGIDWVTGNAAALNIKVANMSLGGSGSNDNDCGASNSDALHAAICRSVSAGITYVVAAGNSGANFASYAPASYPEVLTVTAMSDSDGAPGGTGGAPTCRTGEQDDRYASFSNYAAAESEIGHTIAGPGVCIRSTYKSGAYATFSGTSMAAPHLAGIAALCFGSGGAAGPCAAFSPSQVRAELRAGAAGHATTANGFAGDPLRPVTGKHFGYLAWAGRYTTAPAADITAPVISGVSASSITSSGATITWTTDEASDSSVGLATTAGGPYAFTTPSQTAGVTSHSVALSALSASTTYYYVARSADAAGNTAASAESSFATATPDTTPPTITAVAAGSITTSGATITWTTDEASDSEVLYGTTSGSLTSSSGVSQTAGVTSHSVALSGLTAGTQYFYRVKSKDAAGNAATSAESSFTTAAAPADTTAPTISGVSARSITSSGATIVWTTNEPATSQVEYWVRGTSTHHFTTETSTLVTSHSVPLSGLLADTRYRYRVISKDAAGNTRTSAERGFRTAD